MPLTFAGLKISGDLGLKNSSAIFVATIFVGLTCWIFFECVKRTRVTRFLFGIKEIIIKKEMSLENRPILDKK